MNSNRIFGTVLFFIGLMLFISRETYATSYYVDFGSGSDSNAGTSTGAAWKHSPGDINATGTPASTSLSPGDTVYFRGGVMYNGTINVNWSGSSASNRII